MYLEEIRKFLEHHWYKPVGIVIAEIFTLTGLISFLSLFNTPIWLCSLIIPIVLIALFAIWRGTIKPPKTPKGKVGFLISIACSDEDDVRKVKEDLVVPLMQLVKSGKAGRTFHFMQLPQHLAEKVLDPDLAEQIRVESGAHFMLFGRVRKRELDDGKTHHFFDFEGAVAHQPVPDEISKSLSHEFSELLPRKVQISSENDLFSFNFTSEWADVVARYIIGIAAACSGDIFYAEQLFDDARDRLSTKDKTFPVYAKLAERLPLRKAEIYEGMASSIHKKWAETHNPDLINQVTLWLDKIDSKYQSRPVVLTLRAIALFVSQSNARDALNFIHQLKDHNNPIWHCNLAFLYGYQGDLKHSIQSYRAAAKLTPDIDGTNQINDFICWVIEHNPDKYHLNFCLGFFNWQIRGDTVSALSNFEDFLRDCELDNFQKEKELANSWVMKIKIEISLDFENLSSKEILRESALKTA